MHTILKHTSLIKTYSIASSFFCFSSTQRKEICYNFCSALSALQNFGFFLGLKNSKTFIREKFDDDYEFPSNLRMFY